MNKKHIQTVTVEKALKKEQTQWRWYEHDKREGQVITEGLQGR